MEINSRLAKSIGGVSLLTAFIGSLQYILEHGQQDDWFNNLTIIILSVTVLV
jgi:DHA2 family multidrug resistance protein